MTAPQAGWYDDPNDANAERYWDGRDWTPHRQPKATPATGQAAKPAPMPTPAPPAQPPQTPPAPTAPGPGPWEQVRPYVNKARDDGRRFWSHQSRQRKIIWALAGAAAAIVAAMVFAFAVGPLGIFGGPPLTGEQRFVHDLAVAGIVSDDPGVKANVNVPASAETTASIVQIATGICADLNNGTSTDDEAMQLYQSALSDSFITGFHLSHDDAVTIVRLAVQDVCPGK